MRRLRMKLPCGTVIRQEKVHFKDILLLSVLTPPGGAWFVAPSGDLCLRIAKINLPFIKKFLNELIAQQKGKKR